MNQNTQLHLRFKLLPAAWHSNNSWVHKQMKTRKCSKSTETVRNMPWFLLTFRLNKNMNMIIDTFSFHFHLFKSGSDAQFKWSHILVCMSSPDPSIILCDGFSGFHQLLFVTGSCSLCLLEVYNLPLLYCFSSSVSFTGFHVASTSDL